MREMNLRFHAKRRLFSHLNEGIGVSLVHDLTGSQIGHTQRAIARCTDVTDIPERKLMMTPALLSFTLSPNSRTMRKVRS